MQLVLRMRPSFGGKKLGFYKRHVTGALSALTAFPLVPAEAGTFQ